MQEVTLAACSFTAVINEAKPVKQKTCWPREKDLPCHSLLFLCKEKKKSHLNQLTATTAAAAALMYNLFKVGAQNLPLSRRPLKIRMDWKCCCCCCCWSGRRTREISELKWGATRRWKGLAASHVGQRLWSSSGGSLLSRSYKENEAGRGGRVT